MAIIKCDNCGKPLDEATAEALRKWEEENCSGCHTCMYDDCAIYTERPRPVCNDCREKTP